MAVNIGQALLQHAEEPYLDGLGQATDIVDKSIGRAINESLTTSF
jgi:hypothetical protein